MELHSEPLQRVSVENESTFSNFDVYGYELAIYGLRCIALNTCARFTSVGRAFTGRDKEQTNSITDASHSSATVGEYCTWTHQDVFKYI